MSLPKVKDRKLIKIKEFVVIAKKVRESMDEELRYLHDKKMKNGDNISSRTVNFS